MIDELCQSNCYRRAAIERCESSDMGRLDGSAGYESKIETLVLQQRCRVKNTIVIQEEPGQLRDGQRLRSQAFSLCRDRWKGGNNDGNRHGQQ
jgi:hypothetical protein